MEGMNVGFHGTAHGGIGYFSILVPGSVGMATPGVLLAQTFKSITRFGSTFHMQSW